MDAELLKSKFSAAFNASAQDGIDRFRQKFPDAGTPELSHVAFKFTSLESYAETVAAAQVLGTVTHEHFGGKEITWVKLKEPLEKGGLTLEWLELVEPRDEKNSFDGVTSIGFSVPSLDKTIKLPTEDDNVIFRYQSQHARQMARGK